jgi:Ca2+-binding RTX toxin-like protein
MDLTAGLKLAEAAGHSLLNGTAGNDTLTGNSGSQTLNGNSGNDVYINGSGPTTINAGSGNDTYSYASGSGALTINETGGANTIVLGSAITTGNTSLVASGHDLLITDGTGGDTITLKNQLTNIEGVQTIEFSDASTENLEGLAITMAGGATSLYGTTGNDTLTATSGTETINGNGGNDIFIDAGGTLTTVGGVGNDTYSYISGSGHLVIQDSGGINTIKLGSGITTGNVTLTGSGHDLLITDGVAGDQIDITNQLSANLGITNLVFSGGTTWALEGLALTWSSGVLYGTEGNDTLTATSGTETLSGNGGNDIFVAAGGALTAIGASGNDTYSFGSGDGLLTIQDNAGTDTIKLGSGITTGNVSLIASGHDLLITDSVGGDTLTLKNQLSTESGISYLVFNGGTTENLEGLALTANASVLYGTVGNDTLTASSGTQTLTGNGGNDKFIGTGGVLTMNGALGNDTFIGGSGSQVMNGDGGSDIFEGSGGNDTMNGSTGNDTFIASTGTEKMNGDGGSDIFIAGGGTASATGGIGNDLYSFASGGGALIINDSAGTDTLKLGSGLTAANVVLSESTNGHDLPITDGTGGDLITIGSQIDSAISQVETLVYGDASTLNLTSGLTLKAQTGSSTLVALTGNNTLIAVSGGATESLLGNTGNDTYSYSSGDAAVYISEGGLGGTDTLKLGSGLTSSNVSLSETNGLDLLIADGTGGDQITMKDQVSNTSTYYVEKLVYGDGSSINLVTGGLKIAATSGTATVTGTVGADTLTATTGTQTLNGDGGSDTFIGGTGTQTLNGGGGTDGNNIFIAGVGATSAKGATGNDLYSYAASDGALVISETGGTDTLKLASGLTAANVVFSESTNGHDLLITDGTGGDLITISSDINFSSSRVEKLIYGDGSTLDLTSGLTLVAQTGSSTLVAIGGNNTLLAVSGANTETLEGNTGNDLYSYASGTGKVYISDQGGTDTLKLGTGLTSANVVFSESTNGADLLITDGVTGDAITIHNGIRNAANQIETFLYGDGTTATLNADRYDRHAEPCRQWRQRHLHRRHWHAAHAR